MGAKALFCIPFLLELCKNPLIIGASWIHFAQNPEVWVQNFSIIHYCLFFITLPNIPE